jgi:hypothetical protein
MNHLYDRAFGLFWAYVMRAEPLDTEFQASIIFGMQNKSARIFMHQMMFALAYEEFGIGNQAAFFRLVLDYNKVAPPGKHLGPKKFSQPKSLRPYLKKGRAHIDGFHKLSGKNLRNYCEFAQPYLAPGFDPPES